MKLFLLKGVEKRRRGSKGGQFVMMNNWMRLTMEERRGGKEIFGILFVQLLAGKR